MPGTTLRSCSLPVDDACTAGSCSGGLLCVEGQCRALCDVGGDCPDGVCDGTTCVVVSMDADGGPSDAASPDGGGGCRASPGEPIISVSVGQGTACAVTESGAVWCWGSAFAVSDDGPAPDCTNDCYLRPVQAVDASGPLTGVRSVAVGAAMGCALLGSGEVRCWGDPAFVGGPLPAPGSRLAVPVEVETGAHLADVVRLRAGRAHACALTMDGRTYCWGGNDYGQLGTGDTTARLRAVVATELPGSPERLVTSAFRTQVVVSGVLSGVGEDDDGELGGPAESASGFSASRVVASRVPGTDGLVGTLENTCVVTMPSRVPLCWGHDSWVLGATPVLDACGGSCTLTPQPIPVGAGIELSFITGDASGDVVLGMTGAGELVGWGSNYGGVLDPSDSVSVRTDVSRLPALAGRAVHDVAIGRQTACAILVDRPELWCWGANEVGQLGRGYASSHDGVAAPVCW
jgi:alpha-tubulin suppressor-like RCC1 family protein